MINKSHTKPMTRYALLIQISVIALASFSLLRLALLIKVWNVTDHILFEWVYIFGEGLIYDLAFIGYFCVPFVVLLLFLPNQWFDSVLFRSLTQLTTFIILYGLGFSIIAEWLFWDEFGVRFNFISVDYLIYRREVTDNILQSYPVFWILPLLFIFAAVIFFVLRPFLSKALSVKEKFSQRTVIAFAFLLIPIAAFYCLGQSQRQLSDNNYVNELASNGPYQLFAAFRNNTLDYRQFYLTGNDKELSQILKKQVYGRNEHNYQDGLFNIDRFIEDNIHPKKLNVILVSVESLSAEYLTRFGEKKDITPFMDDWFKQGMLFTNFYATGTRTIRGLESITLSIPPTPGRSIVKRPDNTGLYSLGQVFKDNGYDTVFLYGGRGYFDNMNAFFSGNGYRIVDQTSFSRKEITFKNAWGVSDEDLYNRAIEEANQVYDSNRHFFFHIMTTSNHRPFTYPEGKIDLEPGEGDTGSGRAGGVKYTDYALSQLVKKARQQAWFDDTVFVVLADHCAGSAGKIGLPVEKYHIPLFIYAPKYIQPQEIGLLSSQIDLAPTLLSLLHFSYDSFFFGKDILAPGFTERALIANYQKLGLLNTNDLLFLSPRKMINRVDLNLETPSLETESLSSPLAKELISYYQGADYIIKHRLNRVDNKRSNLAANDYDVLLKHPNLPSAQQPSENHPGYTKRLTD